MYFKTEKEILDLVRKFETAAIPREDWHHREHLAVATVFPRESESLEEATKRMREGILKYLSGIGLDLQKENPYHETLTVFWLDLIIRFIAANDKLTLLECVNKILEFGADKDFPLGFYTRDVLFSERARTEYVPPNLVDSPPQLLQADLLYQYQSAI
jgi:hypothetical protein